MESGQDPNLTQVDFEIVASPIVAHPHTLRGRWTAETTQAMEQLSPGYIYAPYMTVFVPEGYEPDPRKRWKKIRREQAKRDQSWPDLPE